MSELTDQSSLYYLKYEVLSARLGFHVLSLRVLVHTPYCLTSRFLLEDLLLYFGLCTLVMRHLTFLTATCNTRARWRTYKELMSNLGYGKLYERSSGIPNFLNGM